MRMLSKSLECQHGFHSKHSAVAYSKEECGRSDTSKAQIMKKDKETIIMNRETRNKVIF